MRKKILTFLVFMLVIFCMTGCAKPVDTSYHVVVVKIVDEYYEYRPSTIAYTGKTVMVIPHPDIYEIIVEYDGAAYTIDDFETYYKYKDKIGQSVLGTLEICTYDDGTIKCEIIGLE